MPPELDYIAMTSDILKKGNLRKARNWNKRFFVLREGSPAKLEYYESEKKWKSNSSKPKRRFNLERPWNISKKKDSKHEFLIVLFTDDEYLSMAADNAEIQEQWIIAFQKAVKPEPGFRLFNHMWHVTVENKELVGGKNSSMTSLQGAHRVCLTHDQMVFVPATNTGGTDYTRGGPIEIPITKIRVCGHKEGMFFIQPGRSSGIGHGNLWLDLGDEVMAGSMHQTILKVMYALNQEEANGYRGRSYSSGSNAGRTRSIRSHHNNPPPSQIGMGKVSNNRLRCDSLPVTNLGAANDPRLRTGSEGEHTMKKPPRICNIRSGSGSSSPGMRNRKLIHHAGSKRNTFGHYQQTSHPHNVSHAHSASLSGSCNGSSPTSSMECLSISSTTTDPSTLNSSGYYCASSRPTSTLSTLASDCTLTSNFASKETMLSDSTDIQDNQSFPLYEVTTGSYERHYCTQCFAHIPYFDTRNETVYPFFTSELAPSPPDTEPPHPIFTASSSSTPDYVNIAVHSRAQSADENMSTDTAFSSLSASPQGSVGLYSSQIFGPKTNSEILSSKIHAGASSESPTDEYTNMESSNKGGKYPHQKMPGVFQKQSSSVLARLASITGVTSESRKKITNYTEIDYTPMTPTATTSSKTAPTTTKDYVPMRSFIAKHSTPQDIRYRRRSIPDAFHRQSTGSSQRSSPPYDFSPGDKFYELGSPTQSLCLDCQRRLQSQKTTKGDDMQYTEVIPGSARSDSGFTMPSKANNFEKPKTPDTPQVQLTLPDNTVSQSVPTSEKINNTIVNSQFKSDIQQSSNFTPKDNSSTFSSSPVEASEINGYLTMNPLSTQNSRSSKTLMGNILSVAENHASSSNTVSPQYPHEKISQNQSYTNSLDRHRRSPRNKRPRAHGPRNLNNGSTRRSHSLRQSSKSSNDATEEARGLVAALNTTSAKKASALPTPPSSPAGEYVNIDYAKAQEQLKLNSPHLVNSHSEIELTNNAGSRKPDDDDSEYTEMNYNPINDVNLRETQT